LLAVGALAPVTTGHAASALGTYGSTVSGNLLPTDSGRSFAEHAAAVALGLGILPFVVGVAWLLANAVRRNGFAVLASVTVLALLLEVTVFDLRFGGGIVRDRYLFYLAPLVFAGFACALVRGPLHPARPGARAAREGDPGSVPDDPRRLLGERRVVVGSRVLERVGGARRVLPGSVRGDAEHVSEAAPALRPRERGGERLADGLGRAEREGDAFPHLRRRPSGEVQRPP